MINLLLVLLMIAALCGMLWCNRRRTPGSKSGSQVIALLLLVLVLVSGGMFVTRLGTLTLLGVKAPEPPGDDRRFFEAQGVVVGTKLSKQFPAGEILLLTDESHQKNAAALQNGLQQGGVKNLVHTVLKEPAEAAPKDAETDAAAQEDPLILPEDNGITAAQIDQAIAAHPQCKAVIIACVPPSGEPLLHLQYLDRPESQRPATYVLGVSNLENWFYERLQNGKISGMVVLDLTKFDNEIPEDETLQNVFAMRYVLITKDNLRRNHRFFR